MRLVQTGGHLIITPAAGLHLMMDKVFSQQKLFYKGALV